MIDDNGSGHVGVWGQDVPRAGERIASVRQNLLPLVRGGQLNARISQIRAWGSTFKGENMVARSALGEDPRGNILYAASMTVLPIDLGKALIAAGATTAMELDTSIPSGYSWRSVHVQAVRCFPVFPVSTDPPTSTWLGGLVTSSPS